MKVYIKLEMSLKTKWKMSHSISSPSVKTNYYISNGNCKSFNSLTKFTTLATGNR